MDPISTARYGMMAASRRFEDAASRIAGGGGADNPDDGMVGGIVDMVQAKHAFSANAAVIRVADDMWDTLLSLQAR